MVIALIFKSFYAPFGFVNAALQLVGLPGRAWLQDPQTALPAVMLMDVWAAVGYYAIIYLAGMQAIPHELYEAAAMDGGTGWRKHWHITLPLLRSTTLFILVINTIRSFQVFIEIFIMTRGGPLDSTLTTVFYPNDARSRVSTRYASAALRAVRRHAGASLVYVRLLTQKARMTAPGAQRWPWRTRSWWRSRRSGSDHAIPALVDAGGVAQAHRGGLSGWPIFWPWPAFRNYVDIWKSGPFGRYF